MRILVTFLFCCILFVCNGFWRNNVGDAVPYTTDSHGRQVGFIRRCLYYPIGKTLFSIGNHGQSCVNCIASAKPKKSAESLAATFTASSSDLDYLKRLEGLVAVRDKFHGKVLFFLLRRLSSVDNDFCDRLIRYDQRGKRLSESIERFQSCIQKYRLRPFIPVSQRIICCGGGLGERVARKFERWKERGTFFDTCASKGAALTESINNSFPISRMTWF